MFPEDQLALPDALGDVYQAQACLVDRAKGRLLLVRHKETNERLILRMGTDEERLQYEYELLTKLNGNGFPRPVSLTRTEMNGQAVICMLREYVPGQTLAEYIAERGPMRVKEAKRTFRALCGLVARLHRMNPPVVHRDLKAENIIRTKEGRLALIDLDIARTYQDTSIRDTVVSGTPGVAPPEQFGFSQTDPRSDVYAMGVLLQFLLTGEQCGVGTVADPQMRHVIRRCTAFSPENRFRDAAALAKAVSFNLPRRLAIAALCLLIGLGTYGYAKWKPQTPVQAVIAPEDWRCDWANLNGNYDFEQQDDGSWRKVPKVVFYHAKGDVALDDEFEIMRAGCIGPEITGLYIGKCMREIEDGAFRGASSLRRVAVSAENSVYYAKDDLLYSDDGTLILCPAAIQRDTIVIPEGVTALGDSAFACRDGYSHVKEIVLPSSLERIGSNSLWGLSTACRFVIADNAAVGEQLQRLGFKHLMKQ